MIYRKGSPGEPEEMPLANVPYPTYYETFKEMWALYHDKIELKLGLEFGMQAHTIEKYEKLFARLRNIMNATMRNYYTLLRTITITVF